MGFGLSEIGSAELSDAHPGEVFPGSRAMHGLYLIAWTIPVVVVGIVFRWLFDGQVGVVNWPLQTLGLIEQNIYRLADLNFALPAVIVINILLGIPSNRALPFALVVLRPFFLSLPPQLTEAAKIDGYAVWGAFIRVMPPLAVPATATAAIFTFLFGWNDLVFALTMTDSDHYRPLTAGLWTFIGSNVTDWAAVMAFSTLATLPPLMIFLFAQRYVISGLTAGAVKQ